MMDKTEAGLHYDLADAAQDAASLFGTMMGMDAYLQGMGIEMEQGLTRVHMEITLVRKAKG